MADWKGYLFQATELEAADKYQMAYELSDAGRKKRCERISSQMDKCRCLGTGLILRLALQEAENKRKEEEQWKFCSFEELLSRLQGSFEPSILYGESGKPYLAGEGAPCFSLSHSGKYCACVLGKPKIRIGVDVQKEKGIPSENLVKKVCNEEEKEYPFYQVWSVKESYMKLTGLGMKEGFLSVVLHWEQIGEMGYLTDTLGNHVADFQCFHFLKGYALSVCYKKNCGD